MRSRLPDRCGPVGARARPTNHRSGSPSAGHYSSQAESPHQPRIALARHQAAGCRGRFIIPAFIGKARAIGIKTVREPLTTGNSLRVILRRIGDAVGLAKVHPYRFRHTFATWAIQSGAREIDVQMLLGHSDLTMTQRYARTYTSEQAVQAHGELSPVAQLAAPDAAAAYDRPQHGEPPSAGLRPPRSGARHVAREAASKAQPPRGETNVATTRGAMKPGVTLVAKYKGSEHTCEVVEEDGALRYVLPGGQTFKSPSAAGRAITASQVNGYRFWTIQEQAPTGQRRGHSADSVGGVHSNVVFMDASALRLKLHRGRFVSTCLDG